MAHQPQAVQGFHDLEEFPAQANVAKDASSLYASKQGVRDLESLLVPITAEKPLGEPDIRSRRISSCWGRRLPSVSQQRASKGRLTAPWIRDASRGGCLIHQAHIHSSTFLLFLFFFFFLPYRTPERTPQVPLLGPPQPYRRSHEAFEVRSESAVGPWLKFKCDRSRKNPQPLPVVVGGSWN